MMVKKLRLESECDLKLQWTLYLVSIECTQTGFNLMLFVHFSPFFKILHSYRLSDSLADSE